MADELVDLYVPALIQFKACRCTMQTCGDGRYDIQVEGPSVDIRQVMAIFAGPVAADLNGYPVGLEAELFPEGLPATRVTLRVRATAR